MKPIEAIEHYLLKAAQFRPKIKLPPISVSSFIDDNNGFSCYGDGTPSAVSTKLDCAMAIKTEVVDDWGGLGVLRVREVSADQTRGIPFGKHRVSIWYGGINHPRGTVFRSTSNCGKVWRVFDPNGREASEKKTDGGMPFRKIPPLMYGRQCFHEYSWSVELAFEEGAPSISFLPSQEMMEELLDMRDMPPGAEKQRRVIHSVLSHKRKSGTEVREHMRGAMIHAWQGCILTIKPPVNSVLNLPETKKGKEVRAAVLA